MKCEFKADGFYDACECISNWMKHGVLPKHDGWSVVENPERPGYWIAETI